MALILKQEASANVTTPSAGSGAVFLNASDQLTVKDSAGNTSTIPTFTATNNTAVFFNDAGALGESANLTFVKTTNTLSVAGNVSAGGVKTDNLYYANGNPWDLSDPGGSNTQIQFNDNESFGGSANFVWDKSSNTLVVNGTSNVNGTFNVAGNITANNVGAGNLLTANFVAGTLTTAAQPNITSVGTLSTLTTSGNAVIGGNLTVNGNITYINVETFDVEDPIISVGGGPNGAPLTTNDGKDRGMLMHYYTVSGAVDAFMGWDNSNSEFAFGSNVTTVNDIETFNTFGNVRASTFLGNVVGATANFSGNITAANANLGNVVTGNYFTGVLTYAAQPNITSVGTLQSLLVGATASTGDFGNAKSISSQDNSGGSAPDNIGLAAEAVASSANANITGIGLLGVARANSATKGTGVQGEAKVTNTADTGAAVGVRGYATDTHAGGYNIGVLGNAVGSGVGNYAFYIQNGGIGSIENATFWDLTDNSNAALTFSSTGKANIFGIETTDNSEGIFTTGYLNVTGNISAGGIKTNNYYYANGSPVDFQQAGGSNTQVQFNDADGFGGSAAFTFNKTSNLVSMGGALSVTGNANVGNIGAANGVFTNVSGNGSALSSITGANVTGTVATATTAGTVTTAAQPNITSVGTLTSLAVTGNISAGNVSATTFTGALSGAATTAGTVTTAAQPNITSVGTLSSLTVTGNASAGNLNTAGAVVASTLTSNVTTGTAPLTVSSTTRVANLNVAHANVADLINVTAPGSGTGYVIFATGTSGNIAEWVSSGINSNLANNSITATTFVGALSGAATTAGTVTTAAQGNITSVGTLTGLGVNGTVTAVNITANTGVFTGNGSALTALNASNVSSGTLAQDRLANASLTLGSTTLTLGGTTTTVAGLSSVTSTTFVGALTGAATTAGTVTTAAQPNITSVGTLTSLAVTGNITAGNVSATTFTGALSGAATTAGTVTTAAQPNITSVGTLTSVTVTGNVAAGNLTTTGVLSVTGTGVSSIAGNLDMTSNTIINLATPVNSSDAATKQYVDDVAQGLNIHPSCNAATTTTLASISGGTITYNNGTAGVGATLTTTGSYTTIDGVTLSDGMRILVKNEVTTANNGIYVRTSATVLTRATDFDSAIEIAGGDFTFVTAGTQYNSTGWVQIDEVATVGTDPIVWEQFSGAGTYQAGTGLTLTGSTFSVNASQTQITAVGTLGSLAVTGNISAGNVSATTFTGALSGAATTAGTVTTAAQPNITSTGTLTSLAVTGNISAGNVSATTFTGSLSGAATSATTAGTVTTAAQPNITSTGTLTSLAVTGNISAGNVSATTFTGALSGAATTAGTVTTAAQPNITSVGTLTSLGVSGTVTASAFTANTGVFTGNGSGLSAIAGANVTGTVSSATTAGTVTTAAQGNITSVGTLTGLGVNGTITGVNITANTGVFTGNGSSLTALNASNISSGTLAQARLANASVTLGSTALTLGSTVTTVAGLSSVTSTTFVGSLSGAATTAGTVTTAAQPNITSVGTFTSLAVTGNVTAGNLIAGAGAGGNITGANLVSANFFTGTLTTAAQPNITSVGTLTSLTTTTITTGANSTAGSMTGNWTLTAGSRFNATYADLAERYVADALYEPGTVLVFGGPHEVSVTGSPSSRRVAGVVSTNPAYLMNSECEGEFVVDLALIGRVPCKVMGPVVKGDLIVTSENAGYGKADNEAPAGAIIGKAVSNLNERDGIVEVLVGRS